MGDVASAERINLRLNQGDLQSRGGPSVTLVRQIEKGINPSITSRTKSALEDALGWERGVVDEILAGAPEPRRIDQAHVQPDTKVLGNVGGDAEGGEEFEFLTRVREDLTTEEMDTLMEELNPYLERLVRDIKRRRD